MQDAGITVPVSTTDGNMTVTKVPQRGLDDSNVVVTMWNNAASTWRVVSHPRGTPLD